MLKFLVARQRYCRLIKTEILAGVPESESSFKSSFESKIQSSARAEKSSIGGVPVSHLNHSSFKLHASVISHGSKQEFWLAL
jgi:hypothetical protein